MDLSTSKIISLKAFQKYSTSVHVATELFSLRNNNTRTPRKVKMVQLQKIMCGILRQPAPWSSRLGTSGFNILLTPDQSRHTQLQNKGEGKKSRKYTCIDRATSTSNEVRKCAPTVTVGWAESTCAVRQRTRRAKPVHL